MEHFTLSETIKFYLFRIPCQLSQKQGESDNFAYFTIDNEDPKHYPHVHICILKSDKRYAGKRFNDKYKTIGSVRLPDKSIKDYRLENLIFEEIFDSKLDTSGNRKEIYEKLTSESTGHSKWILYGKCIYDYLMNNDKGLHNKEYE